MKLAALLWWPVLVVVLVLAAIALFQDRLLYFPARAAVADVVSARLAAWPSPQDFRGLVAEPAGSVRGTAIVFHGNAGHAGHRAFYAEALTAQGLRVILAEYPGYGPRADILRGGRLQEAILVNDAAQSIELAQRLHGGPLLVIGESLGAGVAAAAASRQPQRVAGLLLITPWDRLANVAAFHYPWLPVNLLLRDRYDSMAHLATVSRPTLVAVAEQDTIVPARFGRTLFAALPEPKRLEVIPAAGHNDWAMQVNAAWWTRSLSFLLGAPASP